MEISKIIKEISKLEKTYMHSFTLNEQITTTFIRSEENFTKRLDEIDIWTLPRIMKEMKDLY